MTKGLCSPLGRSRLLMAALLMSPLVGARAQLKSPSERIEELEKDLAEMRDELDQLKKKQDKDGGKKETEDEDFFAGGLLTLGGEKFRLGGQVEFRFIDSQSGRFPPLGSDGVTVEPDPRLEVQQLRLEPEIDLNDEISIRAQIDFEPEGGDTILKEIVARHDIQPFWWLDSRFQIGLDDRFMKPGRITENYPILGTAFWRGESMGFTWRLAFGDKDGPPEEEAGKKKKKKKRSVLGGSGTEGFQDVLEAGGGSSGPFDFLHNWGEIGVYLSLGQGYALNDDEIGFDSARFNSIPQDDRDVETDLSLRELGGGLGYRRSFGQLGELELLGFYYNDELRDSSIEFLLGPDMTDRDVAGNAVAGYGDSRSDRSYRYGVNVEYFLPAKSFLEDVLETTRGADGPRLFFQYMQGVDGKMRRDGWYVQGAWRVSFGRLLFDRYFQSIMPVVRYGTFDVRVPLGSSPTLPTTWDRTQLLVGAILEVTGDIALKAEYTFNREDTGAGSVDNNELLVELLLEF